MPTPVIAGSFLQTLGSSGVEPLLYVPDPLDASKPAFRVRGGAAFGFLHREFTMYALPALALVELAGGSAWTGDTARRGRSRPPADLRSSG